MRKDILDREKRLIGIIQKERNTKSLQAIGSGLGVSREAVRQWLSGISQPTDGVFLSVLETSATPWARSLAQQCLALRYPKVFSQLA